MDVNELKESGGQVTVNSQEVVGNEKIDNNIEVPSGIGGWLIVVAIGRVLAPIGLVFALAAGYIANFPTGALDILSQPGNPAYSPLWRPTVMIEMWANSILLVLSIILLFLFFGKKKLFPKAFIVVAVLTILFGVIDTALLAKIKSSLSVDLNINPMRHMITSTVGNAIWAIYMLKSVRVKNTFVR